MMKKKFNLTLHYNTLHHTKKTYTCLVESEFLYVFWKYKYRERISIFEGYMHLRRNNRKNDKIWVQKLAMVVITYSTLYEIFIVWFLTVTPNRNLTNFFCAYSIYTIFTLMWLLCLASNIFHLFKLLGWFSDKSFFYDNVTNGNAMTHFNARFRFIFWFCLINYSIRRLYKPIISSHFWHKIL